MGEAAEMYKYSFEETITKREREKDYYIIDLLHLERK